MASTQPRTDPLRARLPGSSQIPTYSTLVRPASLRSRLASPSPATSPKTCRVAVPWARQTRARPPSSRDGDRSCKDVDGADVSALRFSFKTESLLPSVVVGLPARPHERPATRAARGHRILVASEAESCPVVCQTAGCVQRLRRGGAFLARHHTTTTDASTRHPTSRAARQDAAARHGEASCFQTAYSIPHRSNLDTTISVVRAWRPAM